MNTLKEALSHDIIWRRNGTIVVIHDYNSKISKQVKKILSSPYFSLVHESGKIGVLKINKRWWLERKSPQKGVTS